jgi:hypothetical protein
MTICNVFRKRHTQPSTLKSVIRFHQHSDFLTFVSSQPCSLRSSFCVILECQSCLRNRRFDFSVIRNDHHDFLDQLSNFCREGFQINEMQYYIVDVLTQSCEFALKCQFLWFSVMNFNHLDFLSALMTISAVWFLKESIQFTLF